MLPPAFRYNDNKKRNHTSEGDKKNFDSDNIEKLNMDLEYNIFLLHHRISLFNFFFNTSCKFEFFFFNVKIQLFKEYMDYNSSNCVVDISSKFKKYILSVSFHRFTLTFFFLRKFMKIGKYENR